MTMTQAGANKVNFLSLWLHWLILLLLVSIYATMEFRGIFPKGSDAREAMKIWHYMLGLTCLLSVGVRMAARLISAFPAIQPTPPKWQIYSAQVIHIGLYAFMIAMPLIGWSLLSAEGKPIPFFGLQLPALIQENKPLAAQLKELHEAIATAGYFLIGLHAIAALFHHYVVRDNTLRRMSPFN